jgi:hypothetical protein
MHYQFAIDPSILTTWQTYSYIVQDCGVHHGRLIADYPNKWRKMVLEAAANAKKRREEANTGKYCTDLDYARIEYHLQHEVLAKLVVRNGPYNHQHNDWLLQTEKEHTREPFRAIVSGANPRNNASILTVSSLDKENNARWIVRPDPAIPREPRLLADAAKQLFAISKKVKFVDPNCKLEMPRYQSSLTEFLSAIRTSNSTINEAEYHLEAIGTADFVKEELNKLLSGSSRVFPRGMKIRFIRWKQLPSGDELHPRYVLTDRGGLAYEVGLDAGKPGEKTKVYRISATTRDEVWNQYEQNPKDAQGKPVATYFQFVDEFTVVGI